MIELNKVRFKPNFIYRVDCIKKIKKMNFITSEFIVNYLNLLYVCDYAEISDNLVINDYTLSELESKGIKKIYGDSQILGINSDYRFIKNISKSELETCPFTRLKKVQRNQVVPEEKVLARIKFYPDIEVLKFIKFNNKGDMIEIRTGRKLFFMEEAIYKL